MNTSFSYMYRDASNYKQFETVVLQGEISKVDIAMIISKLEDGVWFLPEQVGLNSLQYNFDRMNDDDHVWHELCEEDIELTQDAPTIDLSAKQLVENFKQVDSWDLILANKKLRRFGR